MESKSPQRIAAIDLARGVALVAMTVFHFCWDLAMFGQIPVTTMFTPGMVWFARSIAGSFLFLVGFSLVLAHSGGIRWRSFALRLAQVVAAAALITGATYLATPDAFIFFGILHSIALGSVLALPLVALPAWILIPAALAGAAVVLTGRGWLATAALDAPVWWWTGLSTAQIVSNDFVPVFPFFGMILLGVAAGRLALHAGFLDVLAKPQLAGRAASLLRFIGRNSLVYYLLHQPVMIAILFTVLWVAGRI